MKVISLEGKNMVKESTNLIMAFDMKVIMSWERNKVMVFFTMQLIQSHMKANLTKMFLTAKDMCMIMKEIAWKELGSEELMLKQSKKMNLSRLRLDK